MTPQELAAALENLISTANTDYLKIITRIERQLWAKFQVTLSKLEISADGYVLQNNANRKIIQLAEGQFNATVKSDLYKQGLQNYVDVIPQIDALNSQYFGEIAAKFVENKVFIKNIRKEAVGTLERLILNEGVDINVRQNVMKIINQGINTGASFNGMMEQVREFTLGQENGGELQKYVRTITRDALFNYNRAYTQAVSNDLGLVWYCWSGGTIKTTREFCKDRAEHYYHQKEIESWADLDWAGKRRDTTAASIFVYAGGYNCAHSIIPVHEAVVPQEDIEHARELGFIK